MIVEVRAEKRSKGAYIYALINRKKLRKIVNNAGYLCYDTEELRKFQAGNKVGRPVKMEEETV